MARLDAAILFVDAHIHLWDLGHVRYPWLTPSLPGRTGRNACHQILSAFSEAGQHAMFAANAVRIYRMKIEV
jgi:predicted TIM-barrel fold metal-dependent hydrolase